MLPRRCQIYIIRLGFFVKKEKGSRITGIPCRIHKHDGVMEPRNFDSAMLGRLTLPLAFPQRGCTVCLVGTYNAAMATTGVPLCTNPY